MSLTKSIGWCTHTENPVQGCLGPGGAPCSYCYAVRFRRRLAGIEGTIPHALARAGLDINHPAISGPRVFALNTRLERARKPRRIFFGSMADLGYDGMYHAVGSDGTVYPSAVGSGAVRVIVRELFQRHPRHTFLILSKQPAGLTNIPWPDNVHVGVSLSTSHPTELERVRVLRKVRCGLRWASIEPLLDPSFDPVALHGLDWVVIGAQGGIGAKRVNTEAIADAAVRVMNWCEDGGVPVFMKDNLRQVCEQNSWWRKQWPREIP